MSKIKLTASNRKFVISSNCVFQVLDPLEINFSVAFETKAHSTSDTSSAKQVMAKTPSSSFIVPNTFPFNYRIWSVPG